MLKLHQNIKNEKGLAVFELVPILVIFVLLINFVLGFFGVIHSGILNSIAARNYAFETFRNRANLGYFRDIPMPGELTWSFNESYGFRYHGIISESASGTVWEATKRPIKFSDNAETSVDTVEIHTQKINRIVAEERVSETTPEVTKEDFTRVWVRNVYGICLNSKCGE
jgi:hypothetical protein